MSPAAKSLRLLGAVIVVACVGAVGKVIASAGTAPLPASAPEPLAEAVALTVAPVALRAEAWPTFVHTSGAVMAREEIAIAAEVDQVRLIKVAVDVGDTVRQGQVLALLDDAQLRLEAAELEAARESVAVALRLARATLTRSRSLTAGGAASRQDLERQEAEADTAQAEHARLSARLALKRLQLARTRIVAPRAGVISRRSASTGAVVAVGEELFRVLRDQQLEWRAELSSMQLARVRAGQRVRIQAPDGPAATGTVRQVAPTLSATSRLGLAIVDLAPGEAAVRAGMFTQGRIAIGDAQAQVLPASAVVLRDGRTQVARLVGEGRTRRVQLVAVSTGRRQDGDVEIVEGLRPGEEVVRAGAGLLGDGDAVRIAAEAVQ